AQGEVLNFAILFFHLFILFIFLLILFFLLIVLWAVRSVDSLLKVHSIDQLIIQSLIFILQPQFLLLIQLFLLHILLIHIILFIILFILIFILIHLIIPWAVRSVDSFFKFLPIDQLLQDLSIRILPGRHNILPLRHIWHWTINWRRKWRWQNTRSLLYIW